ncbi:MAG: amino acid ABC transporter substrate-binding protein [Cyanobacteria bacterium QS_8_64_29]|nr:MAG: amino acid ABC transporter substrate-binding protein [Cyanobacteria bacterium QS_8_64_29]
MGSQELPDFSTSDGSDTQSSGQALKIGTLLPVTGDLSSIGQNMPKAVRMAVERANSCQGVNGQPIELVTEDSQTDPAAGSAAASKLAQADSVDAIVGAFSSGVSSASVDVAVRNQVMMVSPGSTSPTFTQRAQEGDFNGFWARTAPPDTYQARALAKLADKRGFKRVSTAVINNDYGVGFEREFTQAFERLGGTIANGSNPVRYPLKAATLDSEAQAAFGNGDPDAVMAAVYQETGSLLLKAAYQQGLMENTQVLLTDGVKSQEFVEQVGQTPGGRPIIAGALGTVPAANGDALQALESRWQEQTGDSLTAFIPHTWDATALIALAAQAAGESSGPAIKDRIRDVATPPGQAVSDLCQELELLRQDQSINYQGASGNVDLNEYGNVVEVYDVWQVREDGSIETVDRVEPQLESSN